jgi:hypothetical protein
MFEKDIELKAKHSVSKQQKREKMKDEQQLTIRNN